MATKSKGRNDNKQPVTVRFPGTLLQQIDKNIEQNVVPISRNTWILEAALEKLRESKAGGVKNGKK